MKKTVLLSVLLLLLLTSCGPTYTVKKDMQGEFYVCQLENNVLSTDNKGNWSDFVYFNLIKYDGKTEAYHGVKLIYKYPDKGININILGFNVTETIFGINKKDGVLLSINGGEAAPLEYMTVPYHSSSRGYGSDNQLRHTENVECKLTMQQIKELTQAKSITVTLKGTDPDPAKEEANKLTFSFTPENFVIINKFYTDELSKK